VTKKKDSSQNASKAEAKNIPPKTLDDKLGEIITEDLEDTSFLDEKPKKKVKKATPVPEPLPEELEEDPEDLEEFDDEEYILPPAQEYQEREVEFFGSRFSYDKNEKGIPIHMFLRGVVMNIVRMIEKFVYWLDGFADELMTDPAILSVIDDSMKELCQDFGITTYLDHIPSYYLLIAVIGLKLGTRYADREKYQKKIEKPFGFSLPPENNV
jgi:hypothetical protein